MIVICKLERNRPIFRQQDGKIDFMIEVGIESGFKIYLPFINELSEPKDLDKEPKIFKNGKILVLDDDKVDLLILKKILEQLNKDLKEL